MSNYEHPITPEVSVKIAEQVPVLPPAGRAHLDRETREALEEKERLDAIARADSMRAQQQTRWRREEAEDSMRIIIRNETRWGGTAAERAERIAFAGILSGCCSSILRSTDGPQCLSDQAQLPLSIAEAALATARRRHGIIEEPLSQKAMREQMYGS